MKKPFSTCRSIKVSFTTDAISVNTRAKHNMKSLSKPPKKRFYLPAALHAAREMNKEEKVGEGKCERKCARRLEEK
jgi:hypothetical protein